MPCALPLMNGWKEKERAGIVPQPDARPTLAQREPAARMPLDAMTPDPDFLERLRAELRSGRRWLDRAIVLGYAIVAGLAIVDISIASDWAFGAFHWFFSRWPWAVLIVTPLLTGGIVWATLRFFPGAGGSGIQHVKAAIDPALAPGQQSAFVSMRLTLAKIGLTVAGFLGGLSIGREGPSVQVAAGVMQHARRWLSPGSSIDARALLIAGGAAGIAGAFNAPLAGVVFAIEELSGRLDGLRPGHRGNRPGQRRRHLRLGLGSRQGDAAGRRAHDADLDAVEVRRHLAHRLVGCAGRHLRALAVDRRGHRRCRGAVRGHRPGPRADRHRHGGLPGRRDAGAAHLLHHRDGK